MQVRDSSYKNIISDIKEMSDSYWKKSNIEFIKFKWEIGVRLYKEKSNGITKILPQVAVDIGVSERELWYIYGFRSKYDYNGLCELINVPDITWRIIRNDYLTESTPETKDRKDKVDKVDNEIRDMHPFELRKAYLQKENQLLKSQDSEKTALSENDFLKREVKRLQDENSKKDTVIKNQKKRINELMQRLGEADSVDDKYRELLEYWNKKNKEAFGHILCERKKKDGSVSSALAVKDQNGIKKMRRLYTFEKNKEILDYVYKDEKFYKHKSQPGFIGSQVEIIVKTLKKKEDLNNFVPDDVHNQYDAKSVDIDNLEELDSS